jgi:hypothetical protein
MGWKALAIEVFQGNEPSSLPLSSTIDPPKLPLPNQTQETILRTFLFTSQLAYHGVFAIATLNNCKLLGIICQLPGMNRQSISSKNMTRFVLVVFN